MKIILILLLGGMLCSYKYLGIKGYGEIDRKVALNPQNKIYRFLSSNNQEFVYKIYPGDKINSSETGPDYRKYKCEDGAYPIQNKLIEGYEYNLTIENDIITDIKQITNIDVDYKSPTDFKPGLKTLKNFISTAFQPLGTTLYVFGGGWDYQDLGASNEGRTTGISKNWVKFFDDHNSEYTYRDDEHKANSYYPFGEYNQYYYAGLDCSGFVGWAIYNNLNSESLKNGFVTGASKIAKQMSDNKYGKWMHTVEGSTYKEPNYKLWADELKVGDIISTQGHVMIHLGKCSDGSFVIMHSTPSISKKGQPGGGVQLSAVNVKEPYSKDCEAYRLCKNYMRKYFKKWSERYSPKILSPATVFDFPDDQPDTGLFHWELENGQITDPDDYAAKSAKEILMDIFNEKEETINKNLFIIILAISLLVCIITFADFYIYKACMKQFDNQTEIGEAKANQEEKLIDSRLSSVK